MVEYKSLIAGLGGYKEINKYYDEWSESYDHELRTWNYKAPQKSSLILKSYLEIPPKNILDLACGTGLFASEILKFFPNSIIDGIDISKSILKEAKKKGVYNKLICKNFDKNIYLQSKYDVISCIGAMTYSKDPKVLLKKISSLLKNNGYFIFTHRVDLWKKQNYNNILKNLSKTFKVIFVSRPILYLPRNKDFGDKIKIKIALLRKY